MSTIMLNNKRDDLSREISAVLDKWTDFERTIFSQSHYQGQSVKSISRTLNVDENIIHTILKRCEQELHTSLKVSSFRI
jgi:DNA-directed RNA polymerase specialized sigma24 family protein